MGVPRPLFLKMISVLQQAELAKKKSRRPHSLHLADKLLLTLNYLSCYRTQIKLSANYNLAESTVNRTIEKVENALIQSRIFALPKKKIKFYSGKKKKHTLKTQVILNARLKQIVSIQIESGRKHDLRIARKHVKELIIYPCVMADLAYKGFHQIKSKPLIPIKKSKKISLLKIAKQINKEISRRRIAIEEINCQLKHFRILIERYRNRWKRFGLRMN